MVTQVRSYCNHRTRGKQLFYRGTIKVSEGYIYAWHRQTVIYDRLVQLEFPSKFVALKCLLHRKWEREGMSVGEKWKENDNKIKYLCKLEVDIFKVNIKLHSQPSLLQSLKPRQRLLLRRLSVKDVKVKITFSTIRGNAFAIISVIFSTLTLNSFKLLLIICY